MPIDFPDSPTPNEVFSSDGKKWIYINSRWELVASTEGASIEVSATAPENPDEGDLWFDSSSGATYIFYDNFWVEVGVAGSIEETPLPENLATTGKAIAMALIF